MTEGFEDDGNGHPSDSVVASEAEFGVLFLEFLFEDLLVNIVLSGRGRTELLVFITPEGCTCTVVKAGVPNV